MALNARNLQASRLVSRKRAEGDEDPMTSMGNLMDVMLVFACALIVALISHYNVDLLPADPVVSDYETIEGELEEVDFDAGDDGSSYVALGMVYQDVETGEMIIVKDAEGKDAEE